MIIQNATAENHSLWFSQLYWAAKNNVPDARYGQAIGSYEVADWDTTFVVPILATVMFALTVILLILFRHNPSFVAGTIAGCLILVGTYLICSGFTVNVPNFE